MQGSKIRLSLAERELFGNAEIILTKNAVIQKTVALLSEVQANMQTELPSFGIFSPPPKISKGENYLGLPYVILDYPRIAEGNNLFFVRSLFWWGNFYSSTLQMAGDLREKYLPKLESMHTVFANGGYSVGINPDPWMHHFGVDNYVGVEKLSRDAYQAALQETLHNKIAARWPLHEWDDAAERLLESWRFLLRSVS